MLDPNVGGYLINAFAQCAAAHAYIIVGEKPYLNALLRECAYVAMCSTHSACGKCVACDKVRQGAHQDVVSIPTDTSKNRITVADVAYLVDETYKRPVDNSPNRVFLINASDSVSGIGCETWQNKLLKTLEEPTAGAYIFIGVTDAESLLLTVRSRCQVLKQSKIGVKQVEAQLRQNGYEPFTCQMVAAMSNGSMDGAERIVTNPHALNAYELAIDVAKNMTSTKNALTFATKIMACKDYINEFLSFYTLVLRESIVYRLAPELCLLPLFKDSIDKICANYTLLAAEDCIERLSQAKRQLDNNANLTVTVDKLLVDLLQLRYLNRD